MAIAGLVVALVPAWLFWEQIRIIPLEFGPETTFLTEPVQEDGLPDYKEALNLRREAGVTPETNAVVLLMQALGAAEVSEKVREEYFRRLGVPVPASSAEEFVGDFAFAERLAAKSGSTVEEIRAVYDLDCERAQAAPWKSGDYPQICARLDVNATALQKTVEASRRIRFFAPLTEFNKPIATHGHPIPVQATRGLARELMTRGMLHLGEGRVEESWGDLLAIRRLAQLIRADSLSWLAAGGLLNESARGVAVLASSPDVSADQLLRFRLDWDAVGAWADPAVLFDDEVRIGTLDAFLGIVCEENSAPWRPRRDVNVNLLLSKTNRYFDAVVEGIRNQAPIDALSNLAELAPSGVGPQPSWDRRAYRSEKIWISSIETLHESHEVLYVAIVRSKILCELTSLSMAVAVHRKRTGQLPGELTDLVSGTIERLPVDPWSGEPYGYVVRGEGFVLYSIGPDGEDDGGETKPQSQGDIPFNVPPLAPPGR